MRVGELMITIHTIGEWVLDQCKKMGLEQAEIYYEEIDKINQTIRSGQIKEYFYTTSQGIGIRGIKGGKVAFIYSNSFDKEALLQSIANLSLVLDNLPETECFDFTENHLYDKDLSNFDIHTCTRDSKKDLYIELSKQIRERYKESVQLNRMTFDDKHCKLTLMNTRGTNISYSKNVSQSLVDFHIGINDEIISYSRGIMKNCKITNECFQQIFLDSLPIMDHLQIIDEVETQTVPVVFKNNSCGQFLLYISKAFRGDMINSRHSFLSDLLGKQIGSPLLNVISDPTNKLFPGYFPFDYEGTPSKQINLIQNGVLLNFIHDLQSSAMSGGVPTGHAIRSSYRTKPLLGFTSLYISNGEKSFKDLVKEMNRGLIVFKAAFQSAVNTATGKVSIPVSGIWVENAQPKFYVKDTILNFEILDLLGNIKNIGNDLLYYSHYSSPSLLVDGIQISGNK
jgi:PmbA protein